MTTTSFSRPDASEFASFYAAYVATVPDGNIVDVITSGGEELVRAIASIPEERGSHRYAEGKWSVREVIGHMIDAERIFSYRILRIARGDETPLASFDQDAYVMTAASDSRTIADLGHELAAVRACTLALLSTLPPDAWSRRGTASGKPVSVRALTYIIAGHAIHHASILHARYGV